MFIGCFVVSTTFVQQVKLTNLNDWRGIEIKYQTIDIFPAFWNFLVAPDYILHPTHALE